MKIHQSLSAKDISKLIKCEIIGNPETLITGINEIHKVESGDLTFVDIPKYYPKALRSKAQAILINQETDCPKEKVLLICSNPFQAYNSLVRNFSPERRIPSGAYHKGENVEIEENVKIYPGVFIGDFVKIGSGTIIHPGVVIYDGTTIGQNVIIGAKSVLGSDAFYFKTYPDHFEKMNSCGTLIIHDNVDIGAGVTIDRGVSGETIIGEHTKIDNLVHIGHGCIIGKRCIIAGQVGIAGKSIIEDDVRLWGQVGVKKGVRIGKGAIVGAQSGVGKSLKAGTSYFGTPAVELDKSLEQFSSLRRLPRILKSQKKL
ncbi:MAG TPA: UDP-3-O-(3-hydroxymyristoyl)glucosamine N-acyltransferase [Oligoflexia bacterium]|nr:UDP-3-O-(3-hydroxymyristoyl)glucosamine N-acyltransferase [Oligoflexia bacterium]HMP47593.1 UDP-3-O-(3-hydroxymyristoyl)glucosamine N-acyltransferase [Oligoflexia bacterium]